MKKKLTVTAECESAQDVIAKLGTPPAQVIHANTGAEYTFLGVQQGRGEPSVLCSDEEGIPEPFDPRTLFVKPVEKPSKPVFEKDDWIFLELVRDKALERLVSKDETQLIGKIVKLDKRRKIAECAFMNDREGSFSFDELALIPDEYKPYLNQFLRALHKKKFEEISAEVAALGHPEQALSEAFGQIEKEAIVRWYGGKNNWAVRWYHKLIAAHPHKVYVEPFGGSFGVGKFSQAPTRIYNDVHPRLVNLMRTMQSESAQFQSQVLANQLKWDETEECPDPLTDAVRFYYRCQLSHSGGGRLGGGRSATRDEGWFVPKERRLRRSCKQLQGVEILSADWREVLATYGDNPEALLFVDPPYYDATRPRYEFDLSEEDHWELIKSLSQCKAAVVLCGYKSHVYGKVLKDWQLHERTSSANTGGNDRTECVWVKSAEDLSIEIKEGISPDSGITRLCKAEPILHQEVAVDSAEAMSVFPVGWEVLEDLNPPHSPEILDSLVRSGKIIDHRLMPGSSLAGLQPYIKWDDGTEGFGQSAFFPPPDSAKQSSSEAMSAEEAHKCIESINQSANRIRQRLIELEERKGYVALGFENMSGLMSSDYFSKARSTLQKELQAGRIEKVLDVPTGTFPERQLRPLAKLQPEYYWDALERAAEVAGGEALIVRHVEEAVKEYIEEFPDVAKRKPKPQQMSFDLPPSDDRPQNFVERLEQRPKTQLFPDCDDDPDALNPTAVHLGSVGQPPPAQIWQELAIGIKHLNPDELERLITANSAVLTDSQLSALERGIQEVRRLRPSSKPPLTPSMENNTLLLS